MRALPDSSRFPPGRAAVTPLFDGFFCGYALKLQSGAIPLGEGFLGNASVEIFRRRQAWRVEAAAVIMHPMWWHKDKPNESEKPLRQQLVEACENVRRQIEVQKQTLPDPFSTKGLLGMRTEISGEEIAIRELEAELAKLEEALATLDSDNSD